MRAGDALGVGLVEATETLARLELPHLQLAVLRARRQELRVAREADAQHRCVVHHVLLGSLRVTVSACSRQIDGESKGKEKANSHLIGEFGVDFARSDVPNLDEAIH